MDASTKNFVSSLLAASGVSSNADEFCKQLVHRVIPGFGTIAALIAKVTDDSKMRVSGKYGPWFSPSDARSFDIWGESPFADAIRFGKATSLAASDSNYKMSQIPSVEGAGSYLYLPFDENPKSLGILGLAFITDDHKRVLESEELRLAGIAAEYFMARLGQQQLHGNPKRARFFAGQQTENLDVFSAREKQILNQMAEGKTNFQIGKMLNLAESTIKQETVRIFRKLGVDNRNDAWVVAKELEII